MSDRRTTHLLPGDMIGVKVDGAKATRVFSGCYASDRGVTMTGDVCFPDHEEVGLVLAVVEQGVPHPDAALCVWFPGHPIGYTWTRFAVRL